MTDHVEAATMPVPYAFPIGAGVRAGEYSGEVIAQPGPYSVTICDQRGRLITSTTSDMVLDPSAGRSFLFPLKALHHEHC
jgi:hypothetical protein